MTKIELLEMLTNQAKDFILDHDSYARNSHMHNISKAPTQDEIDAVLTLFINYVGMCQGVDYALYANDLSVK